MDLAAMIADVEAKLHALQTGRHAVKVTIEGQETEFNRIRIPDLEAYLAKLCARRDGVALTGAIGFWF
jgi:hypothetical protein